MAILTKWSWFIACSSLQKQIWTIVKVDFQVHVAGWTNCTLTNEQYLYYRCHPSSQGYIQSHTHHLHYYILHMCHCISPNSLARRTHVDKLDLEKETIRLYVSLTD